MENLEKPLKVMEFQKLKKECTLICVLHKLAPSPAARFHSCQFSYMFKLGTSWQYIQCTCGYF